ncbi:hypothetical protein CN931_12480 [Bacillus sp. AFS054943]|uniref:Uncharacterized protein n=1 Tax=Bacillus cereus TaxID=1396 RepID=A0A2B2G064_BACCE|nr:MULTISPECIES: hypothetical protein [Bacillus]EJQ54081.1 hypothetical protein IEQ_00829 [Bacillus cereus BAG6X1-2]MBJ8009926.1 hypothetical protein [Bacillus cereus]MDH4423608.1 hypothetical protein [Bacillus cereus]MDR4985832.1 hypothetical protein [Bacillus cereus]MEA1011968.1 hypothetical protein [Bacillus cereus]
MIEMKQVKVGRDQKESLFVLNGEGDIILSTEKKSILNSWCNLLGIEIPTNVKITEVDNVHITTYQVEKTVMCKEFIDKKEVPLGVSPCLTFVPMKDCDEYMEVIAYVHIDEKVTTIYIPHETSNAFVELYTGEVDTSVKLPFLNYNF